MDYFHDFFQCEGCDNKDFTRIYNFSLHFHGVNFSEELIYDKLTHEIYRCTKCNRTYTAGQIEEKLATMKAIRRMKTISP